MQVRMIAAAWLMVAAWGLRAHADPAEELEEARRVFQLGQYDKAIPLLTYLLYPDLKLARKADLLEVHTLLGVAHFEVGNLEAAKRELEEALYLDGDLTLEPLSFSERAIAFFEEHKAEVTERTRREAEARAEAEARERLRRALANMVVIEQRPYFVNFVPFGAGQFQNGHTRKGLFFFASETLLGGTSATLWLVQVSKYGYRGVVPDEDADSVRRMQQVQVATGAVCLLLMGVGVVDALMNYESTTRRPADESMLPELGGAAKKSSLELLPVAGPDRAGVVMAWEF